MKILCRKGFLVFLACFLVISCTRQAIPEGAQRDDSESLISNEDMAELIRRELESAIVEGNIVDYDLIEDKKNIILSTENIWPHLVPEFDEINIILLTPEQIQSRADVKRRFLYLSFGPIEVKSQDSVVIYLNNTWALGKYDKGEIMMSGGGRKNLWIRDDSLWRCESIYEWVQ